MIVRAESPQRRSAHAAATPRLGSSPLSAVRTVVSVVLASPVLLGAPACSSESPPSRGAYTVQFPSTTAAVATDFVQLFVFDVDDGNRAGICDDVVAARASGRPREPVLTHPPVNICEMLAGRKPVTIAYGDKAILAVAQRRSRTGELQDFLYGCAVMTIGEGDAPEAIPLRLADASATVPTTTCPSVADFCASKCQ